MPKTIVINITAKSVALLLAGVALVWMLVAFSQIMILLFLAILLAVAITPLVERLQARGLPRAIAIILIYLVLLGIVSIAFGLLVPMLIDESSQLATTLPASIERVLTLPEEWMSNYVPALKRILPASNLSTDLGAQLRALVGNVGDLVVALGKVLTTLVISAFAVLVVGFFMASDARFTPRFIARFFPPHHRATARRLAQDIGARLGDWVRAQLLVGLFYGVTFGIGLALLGVPYPFSLGVAGAILELIPYVGGTIVTIIAMLLALSISPWLALGVLGLQIVVAGIESHIVYPKLVGDIVGIHPLVIIIALLIGAEAKGVIGALLAVPVTVVLQVLFEHFYRFEEPAEPAAEVPAESQPLEREAGKGRLRSFGQR
jgi:predicted PurR-regulated permease PerM